MKRSIVVTSTPKQEARVSFAASEKPKQHATSGDPTGNKKKQQHAASGDPTENAEQRLSHSFFSDDSDDSLFDPEEVTRSRHSNRFNRLSSVRPNEINEDKQPQKETNEPVKSALDCLSEEDKTKHFNLCIKLSTENKLTAENVFSLHLIDYLSELVHRHQDEPNFQMASITLQASAKIYAVRVDSLHAETIKMASCLYSGQRANTKSEEVGDCAEDAGDALNQEHESDSPKKTRKKKKKKSFICENPASLKTAIKVRKKEPHDKFQLLSSAMEAGSLNGLLFQLPVVGNSLRLSGRYQYLSAKKKDPSFGSRMVVSKKMPSLLRGVTSDDVNFPPTLEAISFLNIKWPLDSDSTMPYIHNTYTTKLNKAFDKVVFENLPNYEASNSFNTAFDCLPPTPVSECSASSVTDAVVPASSATVTDDFDHDFYGPIPDSAERSALLENKELDYLPPTPSGISEISIQEVAKCLLKEPTEYSFIDKPMELQLLGQHILRAKHLSEIQKASEKKKKTSVSKVGRRKKDPFRFTFEDIDTPTFQNKFRIGKRTTLSRGTVSNWLPEEVDVSDSEFEDYKWWSLFTVASYEFTSEESDENADKEKGEHPGDAEDPCPEGDCPDVENSFDGDAPADKHGIQLVPKPHIVKREIISYAKVAKKIDQKLVKSVMWKILRRGGGKIKDNEERVPDKILKPMKFSIAYKYLVQELPRDLASIMSVAIAFTSLLHLANENNLLLEGCADLRDVSVMQ